MKLVIEINLGNQTMLSGKDAVAAVVRSRLNAGESRPLNTTERGNILDQYQNIVGTWKVTE